MPEIPPASRRPLSHDPVPPDPTRPAEPRMPHGDRPDPCGDGPPEGWHGVFLTALRETGNVSAAARRAGTSRSVCYARRRRDTAFAAVWEDALEEAADRLEMEAFRRGVDGSVACAGLDGVQSGADAACRIQEASRGGTGRRLGPGGGGGARQPLGIADRPPRRRGGGASAYTVGRGPVSSCCARRRSGRRRQARPPAARCAPRP